MGRLLLIIIGVLVVGFVVMTGLQASGGLQIWGMESRQVKADGSTSGIGLGFTRLWLNKGTTVYVDYATEINSGTLVVQLEQMASFGGQPFRPVSRRISSTNIGTVTFKSRRDAMYIFSIKARASPNGLSGQSKVRYKIRWGLDNPNKPRKPLHLRHSK